MQRHSREVSDQGCTRVTRSLSIKSQWGLSSGETLFWKDHSVWGGPFQPRDLRASRRSARKRFSSTRRQRERVARGQDERVASRDSRSDAALALSPARPQAASGRPRPWALGCGGDRSRAESLGNLPPGGSGAQVRRLGRKCRSYS